MSTDISKSPIHHKLLNESIDFLCPECSCELEFIKSSNLIFCNNCAINFTIENQISKLFRPNSWSSNKHDVTDIIKSFYEETPFPNYDNIDFSWKLRDKANQSIFAKMLDDQIPYGSSIIEIGCGTGQLSNYLALTNGRYVFGTDICLNSLKLGQEFKERNQIDRVTFLQMNLFRPVFKPEIFDFVICNGVLHHTSEPFLGFKTIANLLKKGGYIIIGLYNSFGRIPTDVRRLLFNLSDNRFKFFDSRLRDKSISNLKKQIWFMDQYKNPHESKHTFREVLNWFDNNNFEFINSIPKSTPLEYFSSKENLFKKSKRGNNISRFISQMMMPLSGGKEGGFFVMIGRKKG